MFDFTNDERKVVLFLIFIALLGAGINFLSKHFVQTKAFLSSSRDIFKLDLNKAEKAALLEVPGIGEKLAGRILEERASRGGFKDKEELKQIKGVTSYRYNKLKQYFR